MVASRKKSVNPVNDKLRSYAVNLIIEVKPFLNENPPNIQKVHQALLSQNRRIMLNEIRSILREMVLNRKQQKEIKEYSLLVQIDNAVNIPKPSCRKRLLSGFSVGAPIGAMMGIAIPGLGNILGGIVGGFVGGVIGLLGGWKSYSTDKTDLAVSATKKVSRILQMINRLEAQPVDTSRSSVARMPFHEKVHADNDATRVAVAKKRGAHAKNIFTILETIQEVEEKDFDSASDYGALNNAARVLTHRS